MGRGFVAQVMWRPEWPQRGQTGARRDSGVTPERPDGCSQGLRCDRMKAGTQHRDTAQVAQVGWVGARDLGPRDSAGEGASSFPDTV